jgi:hypothetical protein
MGRRNTGPKSNLLVFQWLNSFESADLAKAFRPEQLSKNAFGLYEKFRPAIPEGATGWGAKRRLDINRIRSLALEK